MSLKLSFKNKEYHVCSHVTFYPTVKFSSVKPLVSLHDHELRLLFANNAELLKPHIDMRGTETIRGTCNQHREQFKPDDMASENLSSRNARVN